MPSKGLDTYFYNSSTFGITSQATNSNGSLTLGPLTINAPSTPIYTQGSTDSCEINYVPITPYGSAQWKALTSNGENANISINALTGNVSDNAGNMSNMMLTPSIVNANYALSYGFYDAGTGLNSDLTNRHQMYVTLTPSQQGWMGALVNANPAVGNAPFSCFALPGAHDAGTFDLSHFTPIVQGQIALAVTKIATLLTQFYPGAVFLGLLTYLNLIRLVTGLSVTQKDDITTQLNLGCRYFDFRPGYARSELQPWFPDIYHLHGPIPGYTLLGFLTDVLNWLNANPTEIVVVNFSASGFDNSQLPPPSVLLSTLVAAQQAAQANSPTSPLVTIGSNSELQKATSYNALKKNNTRLIFLNGQEVQWNTANKYDSYQDGAYATTTPPSVLAALNAMTPAGQANADFTVLQIQATATNQNTEYVVAGLFGASNSHNPLMSTKALFDYTIYNQIPTIAGKLSPSNLLVLLDDFVDGQLTDLASALTSTRVSTNNSKG